jgi:hypothetical protein
VYSAIKYYFKNCPQLNEEVQIPSHSNAATLH